MRYTFAELLRKAEDEAGGVDMPTRAVIVKELLHYDILLAVSRSEIGRRLVFQGGTALRLCYGGQRYSEDLDFTCGADASEPFGIDDMAALLSEHVAERYGLTLEVKAPGEDRQFGGTDVVVKRWSLNIRVPGFPVMQKIHFEVCNVPSYDVAPMLIQPRYGFLSDAYSDIALSVETLDEIVADKVVALIARRHVKARDLWDLRWLVDQKNAVLKIEWVRQKLVDYGVDNIDDRIEAKLASLASPDTATAFVKEMVRFVTPSLGRRLQDDVNGAAPWLAHAQRLLERVQPELAPTTACPRS